MNCGVEWTEQVPIESIINDVLDHLVKLNLGHAPGSFYSVYPCQTSPSPFVRTNHLSPLSLGA